MGDQGDWGYYVIQLPAGMNKLKLSATDDRQVTYSGCYEVCEGDVPGAEITIHWRLDCKAAPHSIVQDVRFVSTEERLYIEASDREGTSSVSVQKPSERCEKMFARFTMAPDGQPLQMVQLCGSQVPADVVMYFCMRTFTTVQVRIKTSVRLDAHEYALEPEAVDYANGGVYELQCQRSDHQLQVKVQPKLGLDTLLRDTDGIVAAHRADCILRRIYTYLGLYNVLSLFLEDPSKEQVLLQADSAGKPRYVDELQGDNETMREFLGKCTVISRIEGQPSSLRLIDSALPKTRGILNKAFFEVKMALISIVQRIKMSNDGFWQDLDQAGMITKEVGGICCEKGTIESQFKQEQEANVELTVAICGSGKVDAEENARQTLHKCVELLRTMVLPMLASKGAIGDLKPPSTDLTSETSAVEFKKTLCCIWRTAAETYLYDTLAEQDKGLESGLEQFRQHWSKADEALQLLCPSAALDATIQDGRRDLDQLLTDLAASRGARGTSAKDNDSTPKPDSQAGRGLANPERAFSATSCLVQLLFSVDRIRAVLTSDGTAPAEGAMPDSDAKRLVSCLRNIFADMSDPTRTSSSSVSDVANVLFPGQSEELSAGFNGILQLIDRLSGSVASGASAATNDPYGGEVEEQAVAVAEVSSDPYREMAEVIGRTFNITSTEVHVRSNSAEPVATEAFDPIVETRSKAHTIGLSRDKARAPFIGVQGNQTLTQAVKQFTSWLPTGTNDVIWKQLQFCTLPPFLCFIVQPGASGVEWEDSINMTPFATQVSASARQGCYEQAQAYHVKEGLANTLHQLAALGDGIERANAHSSQSLGAESQKVFELRKQLQTHLDGMNKDPAEQEAVVTDESCDPGLDDFLKDVLQPDIINDVIRGVLGVDSVKKLAEIVFDGDGSEGDPIDQLVRSGKLKREDEDAIVEKLNSRRESQRAHMYDVHALVIRPGTCFNEHHVIFARQSDGCFMCFEDEQVEEIGSINDVRSEIAERGTEMLSASVRLLVYRRRGTAGSPNEPLEIPEGQDRMKTSENGCDDVKRRRLE